MKNVSLRGSYALDSGTLIEMLAGTSLGSRITEALATGEVSAYSSRINVTEAEYILCRRIGQEAARAKVGNLIRSGYVMLEEGDDIHEMAAHIKCGRAVSLADCYIVAVAQATSSKVLFAFKERELVKEIARRPFDVEIVFLEELA